MTPQERARAIVYALLEAGDGDIAGIILQHIRAAQEEEREACAQACDAIATDKHDQFKGRGQHAPGNEHRADPYTEGESDGAGLCADAIRARGEHDDA